MRVLSLIPSATEIVCALGRRDALVGVSHECDHPAGVEELPACTSSKLRADGASTEIHGDVMALLEQALSVYRVDAERLRELAPDVVVTQDQCEVCAVSYDQVEEVVRDLLDDHVTIVSLQPSTLADVLDDIRRVGDALGVPGRAAQVVEAFGGRLHAVRRAVGGAPQPAVATIEWIEPLMAAGNWIPELIDIAGGTSALGEAGAHSPWLDAGELTAADPDVIVVMPCGFDLERTAAEAAGLEDVPGWEELRAVRDGRVFLTDGHAYFNRPGPRLADSTEILAEIMHPDRMAPRHRGSGWRPAV